MTELEYMLHIEEIERKLDEVKITLAGILYSTNEHLKSGNEPVDKPIYYNTDRFKYMVNNIYSGKYKDYYLMSPITYLNDYNYISDVIVNNSLYIILNYKKYNIATVMDYGIEYNFVGINIENDIMFQWTISQHKLICENTYSILEDYPNNPIMVNAKDFKLQITKIIDILNMCSVNMCNIDTMVREIIEVNGDNIYNDSIFSSKANEKILKLAINTFSNIPKDLDILLNKTIYTYGCLF